MVSINWISTTRNTADPLPDAQNTHLAINDKYGYNNNGGICFADNIEINHSPEDESESNQMQIYSESNSIESPIAYQMAYHQ